jgi:hypothetical protein
MSRSMREARDCVAMSALGQKQTLQSARPMSALPPKADMGTRPRDVRFVPLADMRKQAASLFDHLVGKQLDRRRHVEPQCLGGLHIDDKLEFGRLLDRQIGRLRTF